MKCQMIRVISSPSSSTTVPTTLVLPTGRALLSTEALEQPAAALDGLPGVLDVTAGLRHHLTPAVWMQTAVFGHVLTAVCIQTAVSDDLVVAECLDEEAVVVADHGGVGAGEVGQPRDE